MLAGETERRVWLAFEVSRRLRSQACRWRRIQRRARSPGYIALRGEKLRHHSQACWTKTAAETSCVIRQKHRQPIRLGSTPAGMDVIARADKFLPATFTTYSRPRCLHRFHFCSLARSAEPESGFAASQIIALSCPAISPQSQSGCGFVSCPISSIAFRYFSIRS